MDWFTICVLISFALFLIYNVIVGCLYGVPYSLSDTFYLLNDSKKGAGWAFTAMMVTIAMLLMPAWIEESAGSPFRFLAFLGAASIVFVGCAPMFKGNGIEGIVHTIAAISAAIFSLLWCFIVACTWYIVLGSILLIALFSYVTSTWKECWLYWLEMVAFVSTFVSAAIYPYI